MSFNLSTEALAGASARRPWAVIGLWMLVLAGSIVVAVTLLGSALTTEVEFTNNPESQRGEELLEARLRGPEQANEIVVVRSPTLTVDDPSFRGHVESLYGDVLALGDEIIDRGVNYYLTGDETLVSADRNTTIMPFAMAGTTVDADRNIGKVLSIIEEADGREGFQVLISGQASVGTDFQHAAERDLQRGEAIGVPIALIVLLVVFGALVAAFIPLILAIASITVAIGATALIGQGFEFSFFVTNVIVMMGLAVGIDYSLFIVSRYREERAQGLAKLDAIGNAGATASRAVFFSGVTVVLALLGMLIIPTTIFRSLASGAILVVVISVLVSLTLLPALLGLLGDRVDSLRVPFIGRRWTRRSINNGGGFWDRVTRTVMRYPVLSLAATAGLLIALAVPYLDINTGSAGVSTLPDGFRSKEGFRILEEEFSYGLVSPAEIVVNGDIDSASVQGAIQRLEESLEADPAFGPLTMETNGVRDLALLSVPVAGDPTSDEAMDSVRRLRETHIASAFAGVEAEALVTGATAMNIDYLDVTSGYTPIVFLFVLGLSFLLLTVVFRSLVVPLKAIIMNLLSVGAAYGALVLVFQKGFGNELFGFQQVETIEAWVPLFTFCILFGLSMDYHVFLLSRIRERFAQTGDNNESVAFGLRTTAGIITGAALIMVAVFGGIAAGDLVMFQQMGFGLAIAVLLDATVVRSVLVPASMRLLGEWNWYLPSALRWLPEVRTEGRSQGVPSSTQAS